MSRLLLYYIVEAYIKIGDLLIGIPLVESEPVARSLMIDPQKQPAEGLQFPCYLNQMFIRHGTVNGQSKCDILSMPSHILHRDKGLTVSVSPDAACIRKIIVISIIPLKRYVLICLQLARPRRPALIQRIIAIHQVDASVRPAQLIQYVILTYIFTPLAAVSQIDSTGSRPHMKFENLRFTAH